MRRLVVLLGLAAAGSAMGCGGCGAGGDDDLVDGAAQDGGLDLPSWPDGSSLVVMGAGPTSARLTWSMASDVTGITAYRVFQDEVQIAEVAAPGLTHDVADLTTGETYTFKVEAGDGDGNWTTDGPGATYLTVVPDPADIAPPLDEAGPSTFEDQVSFLYSGDDPIQTGVEEGAIAFDRVAVIRGRALDREGDPLARVAVTILDHSEFGQTLTREDGRFDLAVNGGGPLTVCLHYANHFRADRQVQVPLQTFVVIDDVVLVERDEAVTTIDFGDSADMQVATGSMIIDDDGMRQGQLLVPPGATAMLRMPDGSGIAADSLNLRITEYTVGDSGPAAMPADLPVRTAYTYAVELSSDEAEAMGASRIEFSEPLPYYVENFLGFPTGTVVPVGSYDRDLGVWVPEENGYVVEILSETGGAAILDSDDDGMADSPERLAELGITDAERQRLAALYGAGNTLWRFPVAHFSTWDANPGTPSGPGPCNGCGEDGGADGGGADNDRECGSVIDIQDQIVGETIPIVGTDFSLNYRSRRGPGLSMDIVLSEDTVPTGLQRIVSKVTVAGRTFTQNFSPNPNQTHTFTWDGLDAFGRAVPGIQPVQVEVGYVYLPDSYLVPADPGPRVFTAYAYTSGGGGGGGVVTAGVPRMEVATWRRTTRALGNWLSNSGYFLGGWSVSAHHRYDPSQQMLYLGHGDERSSLDATEAQVIRRAGGTGAEGAADLDSLDGAPFLTTPIGRIDTNYVSAIDVSGEGRLYFTVFDRIFAVDDAGLLQRIVGGGDELPMEGLAATEIDTFGQIRSFEVDSIGRVVFTTPSYGLWRVQSDGSLERIDDGTSGEVRSVTTDRFGNIYYYALSGYSQRIYVARPGAAPLRIWEYSGWETTPYTGDGGPLADAGMFEVRDIAVNPANGELCVSHLIQNQSNPAGAIRCVDDTGIIRTVAGGANSSCNGGSDALCAEAQVGLDATDATLRNIGDIEFARDGDLYFADGWGGAHARQIRTIADGKVVTVAGTQDGDSLTSIQVAQWAARPARLHHPNIFALAPDGRIFTRVWHDVTDWGNGEIVREIGSSLPGLSRDETSIGSEDGQNLYVFTQNGRHERTLDATTGVALYQFTYDAADRLIGITDRDGNATTIERDAAGVPTAIVGPYGARTALAMDPQGYLETVTPPAGSSEATSMTYDAGGRLATFTRPRGTTTTLTYDSAGRLMEDLSADGREITLTPQRQNGQTIITMTTAEGRSSSYLQEIDAKGSLHRVNTSASGGDTDIVVATDGGRRVTTPDGTEIQTSLGADPLVGMHAPYPRSLRIETPGGRVLQIDRDRVATALTATSLLPSTRTDTVTINGSTWTEAWSATTREITTTSPEGRVTMQTLDAGGRLSELAIGTLTPIDVGYDARGRIQTISQGTRSWTLAYDAQGNLETITNVLGEVVRLDYDAGERVNSVTRIDGMAISLPRDAHGNTAAVTPPGRSAHDMTYTPGDMLESYTAPSVAGLASTTTDYDYNLDRDLDLMSLPTAETIDFRYDSGGRLDRVTTMRGVTSITYVGNTHRLDVITTPENNTLDFDYDGSLPTLVSWGGDVAGSVGYVWNDDFEIETTRVNGGNDVTYLYDDDGLLESAHTLVLTRDPDHGAVTDTAIGSMTTSHTVTGYGEIDAMTGDHSSYPGTTLYSYDLDYDDAGRVIQKIETIEDVTTTYVYEYDNAGRLDTVDDGTTLVDYDYDANGNRVSVTRGAVTETGMYDAQDRMTSYGAPGTVASYAHTGDGRLASKTVSGNTTVYTYDAESNLLAVSLPDGTDVDYVVDGRGRRIQKIVDGSPTQGFLWESQLRIAAELDGSNNVVARFVYGESPNVPELMIESGTTYRLITDHLGSVRLVVDTSDGSIQQRIDYDEYGRATLITGSWDVQPFGFAGGLYDPDTGLVRFGARDYDPETGRWTTKDPIGFGGGDTNLYGYVSQNPIGMIDPSGEAAPVVLAGAAALCAGGTCEAAVIAALATITAALGMDIITELLRPKEARRRDWDDEPRSERVGRQRQRGPDGEGGPPRNNRDQDRQWQEALRRIKRLCRELTQAEQQRLHYAKPPCGYDGIDDIVQTALSMFCR